MAWDGGYAGPAAPAPVAAAEDELLADPEAEDI